MVRFSNASVFSGGLNGPLVGIADLDMALFGDQWKLFATNEVDDSVSVFDVLGAGGTAISGTAEAVAVGQFEVSGLDIVTMGAESFAVFSGDGSGSHNDFEITAAGNLGASVSFVPASDETGALKAISTASVGGATLAATSQSGQAGFTVQSVSADLTTNVTQNVAVPGGDIADVELITLGDSGIAIAIDKAGNEILSYTVAADGTLTPADTLGVLDGLGLVSPDILRVVDIAGQSFGVVAAGSSASISVFEISDDGMLTPRDHVIDGQGTRFASISELEIVEANGRAFVLTAGADDGVTLLELLPDGRLIHHATIEDSDAVSLQNVASLTGDAINGVLHVFATSETEAGLTELTFDLATPGLVEIGGTADDTMTGGAGGDVLFGGHGSGHDVLMGNGGDDILVAGQGADHLVGGAGADVFVFGDAREGGQIDDFNVSEDLIDLSGWFQLHDTAQLDFLTHADRVDVSFGGYRITVMSHDGSALNPADLVGRITINPSHSMITNVPDAADLDSTHYATAGDDVLFGHAGQDTFFASGGADVMVGGGEFDIVSYENATSRIRIDLNSGRREAGDAADDTFYSIEGFVGTNFDDVLLGSHDGNWLKGGTGSDKLNGRSGGDELRGEDGVDRVIGGSGDDTLFGGDGDDRVDGGSDNDSVEGGTGNDFLKGNSGNDTLRGGDGDDTLRSGSGDDVLHGDGGDDILVGGGGSDTLIADGGSDILSGGGGADEFHFVDGNHRITDFSRKKDMLFIDQSLLDDPLMSAEDILATYGQDLGSYVQLDFGLDAFGDSQMLTINGIRDLDHLTDILFTF